METGEVRSSLPARSAGDPGGILLLISIILLQLPSPLPPSTFASVFPLLSSAPLFLYGIWKLSRDWRGGLRRILRSYAGEPTLFITFWLFVLLQLVALIRGSVHWITPIAAPSTVESLLLLGLGLFFALPNGRIESKFPGLMLSALFTFVGINVVLHLGGIRSAAEVYVLGEPPGSSLVRALGREASVVHFPLSSGVNAFAGVVGAAWVGAIVWKGRSFKGIGRIGFILVTSIAALALLFLTDGRAALVFAVATSVLFWVVKEKRIRVSAWVPVFTLLIPILLVLGFGLATDSMIQGLRLGEPSTVRSLSGRTDMWRASLNAIAEFDGADLFGYGYGGHLISGVSQEYTHVLKRPSKPELQGPHNVYLQYILDIGLIGAAVYFLLTVTLIRALVKHHQRSRDNATLALIAVFVYTLLLGTLERVPTVYGAELFAVFVLSAMWMLRIGFLSGDGTSSSLQPKT